MTNPLSTYTVTIGGTSVPILAGSLDIELAVGRRSTCSFDVEDTAGAWHFKQGMQILLYNTLGVLVFGGFVQKSKEKKVSYSGALIHSITGMDYHYLADKRLVANSYVNTTTDSMVKDIVTNYLSAEGVWYNNGENLLTVNQSNVETNLAGFSAANSSLLTGNVQATLSRDTTKAVFGSASLHVNTGNVTSGASGFEVLPGVSIAAGASVTISFYYQTAATGGALRIYDYTNNVSPAAGLSLNTPSTSWQRATYSFTQGASPTSDLRFCVRSSTANQDIWFDGLQIEIAGVASTWRQGSTQSIASGMMMMEMVHNYETPANGFDRMAKSDGYWWAIDERKQLWYQPYTGVAAPWTLDGSQAIYGATGVDIGNDSYRNRQWVVGGKDKTSSQTNTFKGDGQNRNFTCGFQLAQVPTVKVNGVTKTTGIKGVDTGKDWYWAKDDAVVTQDNAGTVLTSSDTLSVTYVGEYPIVAISADSALISAEQTLEGGGTGYVEAKYESATISSTDAAFEIANSLIGHYGQSLTTLTFTTMKAGLLPGQLLTVNLAEHNLSNVQMLIENVKISDADGLNIWYDVTCVAGPSDINWVSFWTAILNKSQIQVDQSNQGTPQVVALLANMPLTWTWTLNLTTNVYACPVPSPTLFPSPTLYPC